ncbi:MAG TPA: hypothetical protein VN673_01865 [Clostridia bacterium]|nr:hypothetical protein [Clostridia bacterium]
MNKWQIICPLLAMLIVAVVFAVISGREHHRYYVYAHSRLIGEDLATATNSPHLSQIDADLQKSLAQFLHSPAGVANVYMGDVPAPIGDGSACSRVVLSNATGARLEIRLRQDDASGKFQAM